MEESGYSSLFSCSQTEVYQKMYAVLCTAVSDTIDALISNPDALYARMILEKALYTAEELYLAQTDGCN